MDSKESRLDDLYQKTQDQWNVLQELVMQQDLTTTAVSVHDSLRQELRHITTTTTTTTTTPRDRQDHPSLSLLVTEIVSTFDELRCTNTMLDQQIHHAQEKYKTMLLWNDQHRQVQSDMMTMMRSTMSAHPDKDPQEEHLWLRTELSYVAQLIQMEHQLSSNNSIINEQQQEFTLDRFILDLIQKFRKSPMDPYILVTTHSSIPQHYIQLLLDCHVIQRHPQSDQFICLSHA